MNEVCKDKEHFWLDHIEAASCSGLSIVQYAKQHDIKTQRLYKWRNVIKSRSTTNPTEDKFKRVVTSTALQSAKVTLRQTGAGLEFDSSAIASGKPLKPSTKAINSS